MKKFNYLFLLFFLTVSLSAQTLFTEDFSANKMPPDGWKIEGKTDNWKISDKKYAGGSDYEAFFSYSPAGNETYRLVSPEINTENKTMLQLTFKHAFFNWSSNSIKFGVATKNGSSDWKSIWEVTENAKIEKEVKTLDITENLNSADFQFCFYFIGNPDDISGWAIDDVALNVPFEKDAKTISVDILSNVSVNAAITPKAIVKNNGLNTITFPTKIEIYKGNQKLTSQEIEVLGLETTKTKEITFDQFTPATSNQLYKIIVFTALDGDQEITNDTLTAYFNTYETEKMVLWESFTNTGCGPCASANPTNEKVINQNLDKVVPIFLHTSWPDKNDPYYTPITNVLDTRTQYYGIQGVPSVIINGKNTEIIGNEQQLTDYVNNEKKNYSPVKLSLTGSISGDKYTCNVEIDPVADVVPGNYKLHLGITESNLNYSAPNGEKHFHWVLRNLYPSVSGTELTITAGSKINKEVVCNLDASWNIANLQVIVFIQNDDTKEIVQAAKVTNLTSVTDQNSTTPEEYSLNQNYPNPFNPSTIIKYNLKKSSQVKLVVYDVLGRMVKIIVNDFQEAGSYEVNFDATNLASGIYFYKIKADDFSDNKKMLLIK